MYICRKQHVDVLCEDSPCDPAVCIKRHPKECKYYNNYKRCKFNPCKFAHMENQMNDEKLTEVIEKVNNIEEILKEKLNLEIKMREYDDKIKEYDDKIDALENNIRDMETSERHLVRKKNILQRLVDLEKTDVEKDTKINLLLEKVEKLEEVISQTNNSKQCESGNRCESIQCEYCDFAAKNQRGLQLHVKAKHEIMKIELKVFCLATDDYLSIDRDIYKKELESEIDVLEDVLDVYIDASAATRNEYVGKLLPTKIVLRSRTPADWKSESFRNGIWDRINLRIPKGQICELSEENIDTEAV